MKGKKFAYLINASANSSSTIMASYRACAHILYISYFLIDVAPLHNQLRLDVTSFVENGSGWIGSLCVSVDVSLEV